ncbi:MAG TPA: glycoside hydrolase family 6 protein, partial [Polyangiaceae bacterium]|nr:glycoside hydrolase family 6 protein [Polyangiaceae bacterium]
MSLFSRFSLCSSIALLSLAACGGAQPEASTPSTDSSPSSTPAAKPAEEPITDAPKPPKAEGNPFKGMKLWIDPESLSMLTANSLRKKDPEKAKLLDKIAQQPQAMWVGDWNKDVKRYIEYIIGKTKADGAAPIFILYNVPGRDCGQHSKGGLKTGDEYRRWIRKVAEGAGQEKAVFVLEPDALGLIDKENCMTKEQQDERYAILWDAVKVLRQNPNAAVFLDAGHAKWAPAPVMAEKLKKAGIEDASGFSLNTSNYVLDADNIKYGHEISKLIGGKHFVIDTSRNGNGPPDVQGDVEAAWCNPPGRALGSRPT